MIHAPRDKLTAELFCPKTGVSDLVETGTDVRVT